MEFTIVEGESLKQSLQYMDNKYPDNFLFCGTILGELYQANVFVGDDDIKIPIEIAKDLNQSG